MVRMKYDNGHVYDGEMEDGKRHGKGTFKYADGGQYHGQWSNDMRHGYGVNTWANGDRYEGNWKNNKKHGKGSFFYANGGKYIGEWEDDMRHGQGENTWVNGIRYKGSWVRNRQHGKGTLIYPDGGKYEGDWKDNMRNGYGVNTWSNGDRYEGSWKKSKRHGQGTMYHKDGREETGFWSDDELSKESDDSEDEPDTDDSAQHNDDARKLVSKGGIEFRGVWIDGKPFVILLISKTADCPYMALSREFVASLKWNKVLFDAKHDRCYCSRCYKESWNDVIEAGEGKYVIPRGWSRLGLHIDPVLMETQDIWKKWIVTFHGTKPIAAQSILTHRQFCLPGDVLIDGTKLGIRPGHIPNMNFIYTSPTIAYSSLLAYSPICPFHSTEHNTDFEAQIVLQCRQMPNSFKIGPETVGSGETQICPHIPNSKIEYFTDRRSSLLPYGLLVRFRQKNT